MNKEELRSQFKEKRKLLSSKACLQYDDLLLIQFQQIDFSSVQSVMTYWPLPKQIEPNTHLFSGYLRHLIPGLKISYPKMNSNNQIESILINESTRYLTNDFGITEPIEGKLCEPISIDMILVPLLSFDLKGYRVGYGKGHYDRFLANISRDAILVGFSYFEPIQIIADTNEFDIPLTLGITPEHIYEF
jgi:5-formyltetrahydrofolate cyclo-ligase